MAAFLPCIGMAAWPRQDVSHTDTCMSTWGPTLCEALGGELACRLEYRWSRAHREGGLRSRQRWRPSGSPAGPANHKETRWGCHGAGLAAPGASRWPPSASDAQWATPRGGCRGDGHRQTSPPGQQSCLSKYFILGDPSKKDPPHLTDAQQYPRPVFFFQSFLFFPF